MNQKMTMNFEQTLKQFQQRAEAALDRFLPPATLAPTRLHEAMRYATLGPGKRVRPLLVYATGLAIGANFDALDGSAAAVEFIHAYSLIHDDLPAMDDDDLRRGRPTCHKAFDEATAILAGDALLTLSLELAAEHGAEAVRVLARAGGSRGVVGGQQDDLDAEGRVLTGTPADRALLERIHRGKTAALIRASCELGALAANASNIQRAALAAFGEAMGLAFQVADDVLDHTADAATLGKTPGKDAASGKLTYVTLLGLDDARAEARRLLDSALEALAPLNAPELAQLARFAVERDR